SASSSEWPYPIALIELVSKDFAGHLEAFSLRCDPCCCPPNWESAQLNRRFISVCPQLAIASHSAARRNVGREDLVDAGIHRPRPCLARFAVVMNPVATSLARDITSEST